MNKILGLLSIVLLSSCSLTAPDGKKELLDDIERDRYEKKPKEAIFEGDPIFVRVRAYPQISNGNVYGKHWILMQTGRQKIDLPKLINDVDEK
jgi:hypothetical protein